MTNNYYNNEEMKETSFMIFRINQKDRHKSLIDFIPERYVRKDYIIDRIKVNK